MLQFTRIGLEVSQQTHVTYYSILPALPHHSNPTTGVIEDHGSTYLSDKRNRIGHDGIPCRQRFQIDIPMIREKMTNHRRLSRLPRPLNSHHRVVMRKLHHQRLNLSLNIHAKSLSFHANYITLSLIHAIHNPYFGFARSYSRPRLRAIPNRRICRLISERDLVSGAIDDPIRDEKERERIGFCFRRVLDATEDLGLPD